MPYFSQTVQAMLRGAVVRATRGVEFQFASETMRVWEGFGLLTHGGHDWDGAGAYAAIGDVELGPGQPTEQVTFTLSGLDPSVVALVPDQVAECHGRLARIWFMCFDATWAPLDAPYCLRTVIMDRLTPEIDQKARKATITLTGEPLLASKNFPPHGFLTPADQEFRHAGDKGLERITLYRDYQPPAWG